MKTVKKAVIPAAGLGTRFLPATKSVPKEMLTVVDAPILFYVVEEAIASGIQDIVLIQGRGKTAIEDFFDTSYELEDKLAKENKYHLLERVEKIRSQVNIISIRQRFALGLGHAVWCARGVVGDEPFAVLLGDEIMLPKDSNSPYTLQKLIRGYEQTQSSVVAVMEVPTSDVHRYGIADFENPPTLDKPTRIVKLREKPKPEETNSRWALPGRYVLSNKIFELLEVTQPGRGGEIQLTDAIDSMTQTFGVFGLPIDNHRYDAGDKLGYLIANIEIGLRHPELGKQLKSYLQNLLFHLRQEA